MTEHDSDGQPSDPELADRRRSAARANYGTTENLEKRQSLSDFIAGMTGRHAMEFIVELPPETTVLDIGCGNGVCLGLAGDGRRAIGVDASEAMALGTRARLPGSVVATGDAECLPFVDGCADAALMLWMLYHVRDKDAALREVRRVLRPGAPLIASTNDAFEEGPHSELIDRALSTVLGRRCEHWIQHLDFNSGNGANLLGEHFSSVEAHTSTVSYQVTDPAPMVAYLDSLRDPVEAEHGEIPRWGDVLTELQGLSASWITEHGSLRFDRNAVTFVARREMP